MPNCYCTFIVTREEEIEFSGWKGIRLICVKINGDDLTAYEHEWISITVTDKNANSIIIQIIIVVLNQI